MALERLPTFEQLCTRAWCITTDSGSGVAQYIRVHPGDADTGADRGGTAAMWPGVGVQEQPEDDTVISRTAVS